MEKSKQQAKKAGTNPIWIDSELCDIIFYVPEDKKSIVMGKPLHNGMNGIVKNTAIKIPKNKIGTFCKELKDIAEIYMSE